MGFDVSEADRLLMTTRSVRRRLDRRRPVPLGLIREALGVAVQAPTSGGAEDWRWLVVTDAAALTRSRNRGRRPLRSESTARSP